MENISAEDILLKTAINLRELLPFYSAVYSVIEKKTSYDIEIAAVDHKTFYYNPDNICKLPYKEIMFTVVHEICHIALKHVTRIEDRDIKIFNIAADLYVNRLIQDELFNKDVSDYIRYPDWVLGDYNILGRRIDINKESVESIYEELINSGYKPKNFKYDLMKLDKTLSKDELNQETDDIQNMIKIKHELSNSSNLNNNESSLERLIKQFSKSKIDFRKVLKRHLTDLSQNDISYKCPDKRLYYSKGIYPSKDLDANSIKTAKVYIDTSGSISDEDLKYAYGHICNLMKQFKTNIDLYFWDSNIYSAGIINDVADLNRVKSKGYGYTEPSCIFESLNYKNRNDLIIIITDGEFFNNNLKKYTGKFKKVVWIITNKGNEVSKELIPFGSITYIKK